MTKQTEIDTSELDAMFPEPEKVTVGKLTIDVPVLNYGQIARILKIAIPIAKVATAGALETLVMEHGEEAGQIMAIALRKPLDYVERMPPDLFAKCAVALFKVNNDFFETRVRPLLPGLSATTASPEASPVH